MLDGQRSRVGCTGRASAHAKTTLAVFSDRLNHASIIDAIRAQRSAIGGLHRYDHGQLDSLRDALGASPSGLQRVVITDGVFSMEGDLARYRSSSTLCATYDALLIVDDCHGTGVTGGSGRGTPEATDTHGKIDVITGTLGKALGGAIGGFIAGPATLMSAVRNASRPYTFSNNPPTPIAAAALAALEILATDPRPLAAMSDRTKQLRDGVTRLRLATYPGTHPIVPVVIGEEEHAHRASLVLRSAGVYATALTFPVVPRGTARLRLQTSAAHGPADIDKVLDAVAGN